jgi:site-specific DNA-methyltransferase (cytosine-N4-specific)
MQDKLKNNNVNTGMRPSGHTVSQAFSKKHKGAIPSNVLMLSNTSSNDQYLRYCKKANIKPHPARFPEKIPEFFIRMLTDPYDKILDPFGGSCTVGAAAERLKRYWVCVDNKEEYLQGAVGRFLNG